MKRLIFLVFSLLFAMTTHAQGYIVRSPEAVYLGAVLETRAFESGRQDLLTITPDAITAIIPTFLNQPATFVANRGEMMKYVEASVAKRKTKGQTMGFRFSIKRVSDLSELEQDARLYGWNMSAIRTTKKTLVRIDLTHILFSIVMDLPQGGILHPKDKNIHARAAELLYVSSIDFGRMTSLLLASDATFAELKGAFEALVKEVIDQKPMTPRAKAVLSSASCHASIWLGSEYKSAHPNLPLRDILTYSAKPLSKSDYGTPILFHLRHLHDHGGYQGGQG